MAGPNLVKTSATTTFECDKSCGTIVEKDTPCYIVVGKGQVICFQCAVNAVYGPVPTPED